MQSVEPNQPLPPEARPIDFFEQIFNNSSLLYCV